MDLSIVVPLFNEAENISVLYEEISRALSAEKLDYELILVDDGSIDDSFTQISSLAARDERVRCLRFRRNFGQTAAMAAGFEAARGEVVVPMDGDLQNDPADIPTLLAKIREGYDVVSGWRRKREDTFLRRRLPSLLANLLISRTTGVSLHDYGCTLKAYRREVLSRVNLYGELHRFVPALASLVGARVTEIPVNHRPRRAGQSKYGIDRTLRVVLDLITVKFLLKYATRPMQLFGKWAAGIFAAATAAGLSTLYMRMFDHLPMNRNPLLILTAFLLFTSIQFIALGLLGELVTRTYFEAQGKPIYVVRESLNLETDSASTNGPNDRASS